MRWDVATRGFAQTTSWVVWVVVCVGLGAAPAHAEPPTTTLAPTTVVPPRAETATDSASDTAKGPRVVVLCDIMPLAPLDYGWRLSVKVVDLSDLLPLPEAEQGAQGLSLGGSPTPERGNAPH